MAQWVNRLRNNIFVNPPPLTLLCEISGALHLAQPGLKAGRQAGRPLFRELMHCEFTITQNLASVTLDYTIFDQD